MATARKTAAKTPARKAAPARPRTNGKRPAAAPAAAKAKPPKADKPRKPKLVRDSFTIPKNEVAVLDALKLRAGKLGRPAKKSEVLRAGIMALAAMGDAAFLATVTGVPAVKTGRPAKDAP